MLAGHASRLDHDGRVGGCPEVHRRQSLLIDVAVPVLPRCLRARDLLAFDNALREHRLANPELTAWMLRGQPESGRATARIGYAGGAPGVNSIVHGNGAWTMVVLANRPPPTAEGVDRAVFPLLAGPPPQ